MADYRPNPDQQQQQNIDPAGSTQMFRAFVDEGTADRRQPSGQGTTYGRAQNESGSKAGVIAGVVIAVLVVLAAAAYFLLG
ncbi:hypothetical protein NGB36_28885 [Streptomyces sp. RB6PN25]|uniref:Uncharacterized protein n=1 Tax=Streptomyces humicola TaxID=2953240 RepID=A0ABT1Q3I6_9ACTN|nr:hypothetical protein [Streptomyces humicola]MCQ4084483.1 hypothetical protein [Streptomyces humicola]